MSIDLGRRLIAAGVVPPEEVEAALFLSFVRGVPFARVLIDRGAITERGLEEELERVGGLGLRQVAGAADLVARLPRAMCRRLAALPVRVDSITGTVDVAAADPLDPHVPAEFGFHLGAPIRVLRAPIAAIEEAIRRLELDEPEPRGRTRRATPPFPHGAPQSTIPPPIVEEAPIPLVRRLAIPLAEDTGEEHDRPAIPPIPSPAAEEDASGRLVPLRHARAGRAARLADTPAAPPAVSFPSEPPPAPDPPIALPAPHPPALPALKPPAASPGEREITPPYGTPVLVPPVSNYDPASDPHVDRPVGRRTVRPPLMADLHAAKGRTIRPGSPMGEPFTVPAIAPTAGPAIAAFTAREEAELVPAPVPVPVPVPAPLLPAAPVPVPVPVPDPPPDPASPGPRLLRAPDGSAVIDALRRVQNRDEVVRLALRGLRLVAGRFCVFAVKRDGFHGWACNVELGDQDAFRKLVIAPDLPSVLATAAATNLYLGPIPPTPAHEALLAIMGRTSPDVAVIAVRAGGRPALILLADELEDTLTSTRFLDELARAVGDALSRLLGR